MLTAKFLLLLGGYGMLTYAFYLMVSAIAGSMEVPNVG